MDGSSRWAFAESADTRTSSLRQAGKMVIGLVRHCGRGDDGPGGAGPERDLALRAGSPAAVGSADLACHGHGQRPAQIEAVRNGGPPLD